jgi:hypothetical protein
MVGAGIAGVEDVDVADVPPPPLLLFFPNINVHFEDFFATVCGCCDCVPAPDPTERVVPLEVLNRDGVLVPSPIGLLNSAEGSAYIDTGSYLLPDFELVLPLLAPLVVAVMAVRSEEPLDVVLDEFEEDLRENEIEHGLDCVALIPGVAVLVAIDIIEGEGTVVATVNIVVLLSPLTLPGSSLSPVQVEEVDDMRLSCPF